MASCLRCISNSLKFTRVSLNNILFAEIQYYNTDLEKHRQEDKFIQMGFSRKTEELY